MNKKHLIDKLYKNHSLTLSEYEELITSPAEQDFEYIREKAEELRRIYYGNKVFIRGLIEIGNICKNTCFYCGINGKNEKCQRYRLTPDKIFSCCEKGYALGFRTFVLQGGEDGFFSDEILVALIKKIKSHFPDCAVTLSLGERSKDSYKALFLAGADRYLLRHECASRELYYKLHPQNMSYENRMECLENLKEIGYQTGCGFMVGAPFQTLTHIAEDLKFIENFGPQMCGIGPFVPHKDTCFKAEKSGSGQFTCYLLSVIRLINPKILLPATTALGTVNKDGREKGILYGANVIMPNLSPENVRKKYDLYDNKLSTGAESGEGLDLLKKNIKAIGYEIEISRGDAIK